MPHGSYHMLRGQQQCRLQAPWVHPFWLQWAHGCFPSPNTWVLPTAPGSWAHGHSYPSPIFSSQGAVSTAASHQTGIPCHGFPWHHGLCHATPPCPLGWGRMQKSEGVGNPEPLAASAAGGTMQGASAMWELRCHKLTPHRLPVGQPWNRGYLLGIVFFVMFSKPLSIFLFA